MMQNNKIKVVFILPSMTLGGAEKVISILLKYLSREKFEVVLILIKKEGVFLDEVVDDIKIVDLGYSKIRYSLFKIIKSTWQIKPDIVFSTLGYLNLFIMLFKFCFPTNIKFIARESNIPSRINNDEKHTCLFNFLYKRLYPQLDKIICQSKDMRKDLITNYTISDKKIKIINNPVDFSKINNVVRHGINPFLNKEKINLLAVGRLEYQKGFDLLIKAFFRLDSGRFHLTIVGEGSEKESLLKLSKILEVSDSITFTGFQKNPYMWMKYADIFILSSRYEGFPNAVLESMACGTPVVAFECPGGINEIVINELNGLKVKKINYDSLAAGINRVAEMDWDSDDIIRSISSRYTIERIVNDYEILFERI